MHTSDTPYDVAIIGGGVAGLALSIQLARAGYSVCLLEKDKYPFHRVCGEYISLEAWNFLRDLGVPLDALQPPILDTLLLTSPKGRSFTMQLPLGGFGISRYTLDAHLAHLAKQSGVILLEETKAEDVEGEGSCCIRISSRYKNSNSAGTGTVHAKLCCGAFGKRSNMDVRWKRAFLQRSDKKLDNYIGVKYHVLANWKANVIGLHNFPGGYCGISKVEGDRFCMCYMTKAESLKANGNDITQMERQVLCTNPHLEALLTEAVRLDSFPVTISQISFSPKTQVEQGVLLLGDAAGMITPLCGNGMSMALHGSKIAFRCIAGFLQGQLTRSAMEQHYAQQWRECFAGRLSAGRALQRFFGKETASNLFINVFRIFPFLARPVVKRTHGTSF